MALSLILFFAGFYILVKGANRLVDGASSIAKAIGISDSVTALTIVGVGTSLPEFAVTFIAALRNQTGVAVGNIIGSNIFDFLMILGFAAIVKPIVFPQYLFPDIVVTLLAASLLYGFMYTGRYFTLKRWQGLFFVFLYIVYVAYILGRN